MEIAFFTDTYEPQINGVVTSINIYRKYIEKLGNKVYVFCPRSKFRHRKNVFTFSSIDFPQYPGYRIALPYQIKNVKKFDIFHVHTPFSVGLMGLVAAKFYGKPVVGTFHTMIPEFTDYLINTQRFKKFLKSIAWRYSSWFYNMCDAVIAPSPEIKTLLQKHGIKRRIEVVPTGIEKPRKLKKSILRKKCGFSGKEKILLHVGRISREKNIGFIINALRNKPKNWVLIIASDGPYKFHLEKMVSRLGMDGVIFTGFISGKKLNELYYLADALLVASKSETQSIVLAEAVSRGLPAVALSSPVTANFIRKNSAGIATNSEDFFDAIKNTLSGNKRVQMKGYMIEETTNSIIEIYKSLIASNS